MGKRKDSQRRAMFAQMRQQSILGAVQARARDDKLSNNKRKLFANAAKDLKRVKIFERVDLLAAKHPKVAKAFVKTTQVTSGVIGGVSPIIFGPPGGAFTAVAAGEIALGAKANKDIDRFSQARERAVKTANRLNLTGKSRTRFITSQQLRVIRTSPQTRRKASRSANKTFAASKSTKR